MPEDTINDIIDKVREGLDEFDKIKRAVNFYLGEPVSIGDREKVEDCIKELTVAEVFEKAAACKMLTNEKTWKYGIDFHRLGIKTDELEGSITLKWSYDGCGLYDMMATEKHSPVNSDWEVRLKPRIYPLKIKKKGNCPCCNEGGVCVVVHIEWEVERDIALWPNSVVKMRESGIICAADGVFRPI